MPRLRTLLLLVAFAFAATTAGCQLLPAKTIDNPSEGSPEWVVYKAIEAALMPKTDDGWEKLKPLLHSELLDSRGALQSFRENNFEAFHRKATLFSLDDKTGAYKLDRTEDNEKPGEIVKLFVVNEKSDMPTPCRLKRDPKQNNEWRISQQCSL